MASLVRAFGALTGEVLGLRCHLMDQPVASPVTEGDLLAVFSLRSMVPADASE